MTALVTALSLHQAGHAAEAAAMYAQILAKDPDNVDALYLLGILARQMKQPAIAIPLIQRAITLKHDVAQFHNHLGEAFLETGDAENGRRAFLRALQISPRYPEALLNLADLLNITGNIHEATSFYGAALRLYPDKEMVQKRLKNVTRSRPPRK